jgi:hypothetical protein
MFKQARDYALLIAILAVTAYLVHQFLIMQLALLCLVWLGFFGFEYAMNGGTIKRCFPEDFALYGINGEKNRAEFAKKQLEPSRSTILCGGKKIWRSSDNHDQAQYIACGNDILGKGYYFWLSKIIIPLIIALYLIINRTL